MMVDYDIWNVILDARHETVAQPSCVIAELLALCFGQLHRFADAYDPRHVFSA